MPNFVPSAYMPGALVVAGGAAFAVGAATYPLGTLLRPGPGFFPLVIAVAMIAMGLGVLAETWRARRTSATTVSPGPFGWGAVVCTSASILIFALTVERIGYVPATLILFAVCGLAERGRDWLRLALVAVLVALIGTLVFIYGLGLPVSAFGGS